MKKLALIVLAIAIMIVPLSVGASAAAGDINQYEKAVIDSLSEKVAVGDAFFSIPKEYITQAENFLKTIDMTEPQSKTILAEIADSKEIVIKSGIKKTSDLKVLPLEQKRALLTNGEQASEAVGAVFTYDGADVIVTYNGTPVFQNAPIIKVTGAESDFTVTVLAVAGVVALLAAATVIASKKGLLSK